MMITMMHVILVMQLCSAVCFLQYPASTVLSVPSHTSFSGRFYILFRYQTVRLASVDATVCISPGRTQTVQ